MTVAPTVGPAISPELLRRQCRVDGASLDDELLMFLDAAVAYAENYQWSQLLTSTWKLRLDRFPCGDSSAILLHPNPVATVTSVQYVDTGGTTQTLTVDTDYTVDLKHRPARIVPAYTTSWPVSRGHINDVIVTFTAGYGAEKDIPPQTKQALLLMVGYWFRNRESAGSGSMTEIPFATKALLSLNSFRTFY